MGYRITYGTVLQKVELSSPGKKQIKIGYVVAVSALILTLVLGCKYWQFLLPGDSQVTERALHELAENLREGEQFSDAVTAFCREILESA